VSSPPDIVYVVRPGEQNEELRYSLRSLINLPHGRVWVAGFCPWWVIDVGVIRVATRPGGHQSAKANLRAACEHPDVSEQFVYFNDDFFVMQPLERMPILHRGLIDEAIRQGMRSWYTRAMRATRDLLVERGISDPLCYELHAPTLVTKQGMLEALDLCHYPMVQERSMYANLQRIGGMEARNFKVYRGDYGWRSWPFLSTNDSSFGRHPVGEYVRGAFDTPSPYERATPVPAVRDARVARIRHVRRPVRYSNVSVVRRVSAGATP
jgi:hypothetical protein